MRASLLNRCSVLGSLLLQPTKDPKRPSKPAYCSRLQSQKQDINLGAIEEDLQAATTKYNRAREHVRPLFLSPLHVHHSQVNSVAAACHQVHPRARARARLTGAALPVAVSACLCIVLQPACMSSQCSSSRVRCCCHQNTLVPNGLSFKSAVQK